MENERALVIGGSGLVGSYLLPELSKHYKSMYVTSNITRPKLGNVIEVDVSKGSIVTKVLEKVAPDIIVNLAAFTDVDGCEKHKEYALKLNSELTRFISDYVKSDRSNGPHYVLHVSTDYVFDGREGNYNENSPPNPINWYGKTKLSGEKHIMSLDDHEWCIARISNPFGIHEKRQTFPIYVINKLRVGQNVPVITDQFNSSTYAADIAIMITEVIEKRIKQTIHIASITRSSRYDQAIKVAKVFGLDKDLIVKSSSDDMNWLAARPKDSSLHVAAAQNLLRNMPRDYEEGLREFASEFSSFSSNA
jgi:dTDP-4-dehydrorhamnose reductase